MSNLKIAPLRRAPVAARSPALRDRRLGIAVGAVGLACAPWLAMQAHSVWLQAAHYHFLPIVPLAAAALAVRGARGLGVLRPGVSAVTLGLLVVSWLLAAGADVFYSPALGTVAALVALAALAHGLGGTRLLRALAPAGLVLALAIRPPLGLDGELINWMQSLATEWTSRILDILGVYHQTAGHVLEIAERRLFVEEACSGITSLFVVLVVTLCAALWLRRGWFATASLLVASAAWVLLGNVARLTSEVYALARWRVDITGGWHHEMLGLLILAVVLGLVASTDRLIARLSASARQIWTSIVRWATRLREERLARRLAWQGAAPEEIARSLGWSAPAATAGLERPREPTRWPDARGTLVGSWPVVAVIGATAMVNGAAAWRGLPSSSPLLRLAKLEAGDLPDRWGALRRESFESTPVGPKGTMAPSWRRWEYRPDGPTGRMGLSLTASVDDPYLGWHEAADCYRVRGWVVDSRRIEPADGADRVVVRMTRPLEGTGLLIFAYDDARGAPVNPPSGAGWRSVLGERITQGWWRLQGGRRSVGLGSSGGLVPTYLVQVLVQSDRPLSIVDEQRALAFFDQARTAVRRRVRPEGGGLWPRTTASN
jgi:exosortase